MLLQIRVHGRGGQGVVTLAELLATAAFRAGHEAQAIPSFGSERMGAPVMSFCRVARGLIRTREPVLNPDLVVICDPTLLHSVDVFAGLTDRGTVLINSSRTSTELGLDPLAGRGVRVHSVPATALARDRLGMARGNVALLGACAYLLEVFTIREVTSTLAERPRLAAQVELADAGYEWLAAPERDRSCAS